MKQTKQTRLEFLDNLFSTGHRLTVKEALSRYKSVMKDSMSTRTFWNLKAELEHLGAEFERHKQVGGWAYSYAQSFSLRKNILDKEDVKRLTEALNVLRQFEHLPQWRWLEEVLLKIETHSKLSLDKKEESNIVFQHHPSANDTRWLRRLYEAIQQKQVLEIIYQPFEDDDSDKIRFQNARHTEGGVFLRLHPYLLKEWNTHWHIFGWFDELGGFSNIALDRIKRVEPALVQLFRANKTVDFDAYFQDVYGITHLRNQATETFTVRLSPIMAAFIRNRPIHASQQESLEAVGVFTFELKWNWEWQAKVLSWGMNAEVIEPQWFRDKIAEAHRSAAGRYG